MNSIHKTFKLTIGSAVGYALAFLLLIVLTANVITLVSLFSSYHMTYTVSGQLNVNNIASVVSYSLIVSYFFNQRDLRFSYRLYRIADILHLSIIAGLMGFALAVSFNYIFSHIPGMITQAEFFERLQEDVVVFYMLALIIAPIFEEIIFRGILLRGLLNQYSARKAIISSALIFGLFHLSVSQLVSATIMGILFGLVYHRTRSLCYVSVMHFVANGVILFCDVHITPDLTYNYAVLGGIILAIVGVIIYMKKWLQITATKTFDGRPAYMYSDMDQLQSLYDEIDLS